MDACHEWFKLGLDPNHLEEEFGLAVRYPSSNNQAPRYTFSPEKLTIDYLTALRNHAEYSIQQILPDIALKSIPREYVITVPAVWSDMAKDLTRSCAEKAKMGHGNDLHIISEPEAAATYALSAVDLEVGDTFVLCDAGGGYVFP